MINTQFIDPICGMKVDPSTAAGSYSHEGTTYYFCSKGCLQKFIEQSSMSAVQAPVKIGREKQAAHNHHHESGAAPATVTDPVCRMVVDPAQAAGTYEYNGTKYYFCAVHCKERFVANPELF